MRDADCGDDRDALARAVTELEALARAGERPNRYHARAVLVPYGRLLLAHGEGALDAELEARLEAFAETLGQAWAEAIQAELSLACAEHVHAADPRYLGLSNYDWEYTLAARGRLEARLVAADRWDSPCPPALRAAVERADALLAAAGHAFEPGSTGP